MTAIVDEPPGLVARMVRRVLLAMYRGRGWRALGQVPEPRRFIIIAAPHTSNWDFVYFVGGAGALDLNLSFMGKASLFRWPFDGMMRDLGGVSVNRAASKDMVGAMVEEVNNKPVYTIHELLEGKKLRPSRLFIVGGPAGAVARPPFVLPRSVPAHASRPAPATGGQERASAQCERREPATARAAHGDRSRARVT